MAVSTHRTSCTPEYSKLLKIISGEVQDIFECFSSEIGMNRKRSQKIDSVQGWLSPVSDGYGKPGLGIGTIYGLRNFS